MDNKGQAFSTFQLLIAAIIAIVILIILLAILRVIPGISSTGDPVQATSDKLKDAATKLTQHFKTDIVTFTKGYTMLAKSIVTSAEVGLEEDQLCLSRGDFGDETEIWAVGDKHEYIKYKGSVPKDVKISIVCDTGTNLEDTVRAYSGEAGGLKEEWVSDCPCVGSGEICCLIALRYRSA